jgi:aldose 1-epimerase
MQTRVSEAAFGDTPEGAATLYTLTNANGLVATITNYGGILTSLRVPDRSGAMADVVLGFSDLAGYVADESFQGAVIGRYANRIGGARFTLDGASYQLAANNGPNSLHGGPQGFHKRLWASEASSDADGASVTLTRVSADGEEGFPGALNATVRYSLNDRNELVIAYSARTDKPTIINLTQHAYWNLAGEGIGDILGHRLTIAADAYTPVDADLIPTGELAPVEGSPFDFRSETAIGARIDADDAQLRLGRGYDHNWVLSAAPRATPAFAARLVHPESGRVMEVRTTEPGLQFYSGNFLDGSLVGKSGSAYGHRSALCLETQHFPDSPNKPAFPSTVLRPGEEWSSTSVYAFSAA